MNDNSERSHSLNTYSTKDLLPCLLCSFVFLSLASPVLAQWTAPNFIVTPKDPWQSVAKANNGKIPEGSSFLPNKFLVAPATAQSTAAGNALTQAAAIYDQVGLKEPVFSPKYKNDTRGVFMYPSPGTAGDQKSKDQGEYFSAACDKDQKYNYKRFAKDWMMLDQNLSGNDLYATAAHELFHAIQVQYPYHAVNGKPRCTPIRWIDEATADAAAYFLLEAKLQGNQLPKDLDFYGLRPYDVPLYEDLGSWNTTAIKSRFTLKPSDDFDEIINYHTSSFWRFLMDRIKNLSTFDPKRLQVLATMMNTSAPGDTYNQSTWLDWTATPIQNILGNVPFSHVYGQFLAEFASWPGSKYPDFEAKEWLYASFGKCGKVTLTPQKKIARPPIVLQARQGMTHALYPLSGRCIQVTVKGFKGKKVELKLESEVEPIAADPQKYIKAVEAKDLADQLLLGFSREESGTASKGKLVENCYRIARTKPKEEFPCVYFGKVNRKKTKAVRSWRFEIEKVKHSTLTRTYILSNVHPKTASKTQGIPRVNVRVGIRVFNGKTQKWTKFSPPESFNLGQLPDVTIPRRQALYGIKKNSSTSTGYPMNLAPIQVAALDETGNQTETYSISPLEKVAFGQTGPLKAMVMAGSGGMSAGTIGSQFCQAESQPGTIGEISRSDDEGLEISIDTPLCQLSITNIAACQNGCPVVDHIQGKLSLPFGWRYFAENEVEDLVTPGVLLDIDRYHHQVYGTPLQGLSSIGNSASGTGGGNSGTGKGNGQGGQGTGSQPCDCSCSTYKVLKQATSEKPPNLDLVGKMVRCAMPCAKSWRDCRRAMKTR